jgi:hypothetical protein
MLYHGLSYIELFYIKILLQLIKKEKAYFTLQIRQINVAYLMQMLPKQVLEYLQ